MYQQVIRNQQTGEFYAPQFNRAKSGFETAWTAAAGAANTFERCGDDRSFDRTLKGVLDRTLQHLRGLGFTVEAVRP